MNRGAWQAADHRAAQSQTTEATNGSRNKHANFIYLTQSIVKTCFS